MTLRKRIAALLLCICIFAACLPGAASAASKYRFSGDGNKFTVYVRVFVPSEKSSKHCIGHYDLMVKGAVIRFRGRTFVNPCFSYNTGGKIEVFNQKDTSKVYPKSSPGDYYYGCKMYYWRFTVKGRKKMGNFLKSLNGIISSSRKHSRCSRALSCNVKSSSVFHKYSAKKVNCFYAVATWMKGFGISKLLKIYKSAYKNGTSYLPKAIKKRYGLKKS